MDFFNSTPDRVAFSIGSIDIMWYGILIAIGFALCIYIICNRAPRHGLTSDRTLSFSLFVAVAGIVGARLYYVIFQWQYYAEDPSRIFQVREGGLAIHGGLIFGCLTAIVLCKVWKERPLNVMDLFFATIPLGQAIGRWGNYFNSEAHGGPTDLPWGILVDGQKVHPTFLYESIWCFFLFFLLWYIDNRRSFVGQTFFLYCILYSAERFFVEGLRTDSLMLGVLKQAQVLSLIVIAASVAAYLFFRYRHIKSGEASVYLTAMSVAGDAIVGESATEEPVADESTPEDVAIEKEEGDQE